MCWCKSQLPHVQKNTLVWLESRQNPKKSYMLYDWIQENCHYKVRDGIFSTKAKLRLTFFKKKSFNMFAIITIDIANWSILNFEKVSVYLPHLDLTVAFQFVCTDRTTVAKTIKAKPGLFTEQSVPICSLSSSPVLFFKSNQFSARSESQKNHYRNPQIPLWATFKCENGFCHPVLSTRMKTCCVTRKDKTSAASLLQ